MKCHKDILICMNYLCTVLYSPVYFSQLCRKRSVKLSKLWIWFCDSLKTMDTVLEFWPHINCSCNTYYHPSHELKSRKTTNTEFCSALTGAIWKQQQQRGEKKPKETELKRPGHKIVQIPRYYARKRYRFSGTQLEISGLGLCILQGCKKRGGKKIKETAKIAQKHHNRIAKAGHSAEGCAESKMLATWVPWENQRVF